MDHRTSKLAVAALVLGLLAIFLSAGVAAVVLGVVALYRIHKSSGQLVDRGMAKAGIIIALLIPPSFTYIEMHRCLADRMVCGGNLAGMGKAMQTYTEDHDGNFPTPAKWCDILLSTTRVKPDMLQCGPYRKLVRMRKYPLDRYFYVRWRHARYFRAGECDYAMNPDAIKDGTAGDPNTVLMFESGPGWNQVGGPEAITAEHHAGDGCAVLFLGGYARFVHTQEFAKLRWQP